MSKQFLSEVNESQEVNESFQKEKFEKIKPDLTKYYILVGLVFISIISLYFILNQKVQVTNMVGWSVTDAQSWASNNELTLVATSEYSLETEDTIISQSIEAGENVSKKSTINIVVSLGADPDELIVIPDFDETWTKASILSWLKEEQISDYTFTTQLTNTGDSNYFVEYSLDVDKDSFKRSDSISFVVTSNTSSSPVTVVDFSNYSKDQIDEWAEDNNIKISYIYEYSSSIQEDKVIDQSVEAEEEIDQNSTIKITLSLGESVKIVDFSSYNQTDAKAWATENGINLTIETQYNNSVMKGVAIYQDLVKNSIVAKNTKLKIIYSLGSSLTLGSYVNKPLTELVSYIDSQNTLNASLKLNVTYQYSNSVSINQIISHSPVNTNLSIGETIDVIVSLGRLVSVPDFSSVLNNSESIQNLYNAVLELCNESSNPINGRISLIDKEGDERSIVQSVSAGTLISNADFVDIVIYY